jgi:autotransporter strand-loop-strand O-heptosyltransferase
MKNPAFLSTTPALGDLICATPTIRKLSQVYGSPVLVISHNPDILKNLPYVSKSLNLSQVNVEDLEIAYDLHKSFHLLGKQDHLGIEFKHAICDIRQFHAKDLGFMLLPEEMSCDYVPSSDSSCLSEIDLPASYVVLHAVKSWESRTWDPYKWQILANSLENCGIDVVVIGKDSGEYSSQGNLNKPAFSLKLKRGKDLTNSTSLDQSWHILNRAKAVVTMDSGIMHLAGTTDVHIIQLGSNIHPLYRIPYRKGTQDYKYSYVNGSCSIHCASDMRYSLRDWGGIQNVTLIETCLEPGKNFSCKPDVEKVIEEVQRVWRLNEAEDIEEIEKIESLFHSSFLDEDLNISQHRVEYQEAPNSAIIKIVSGSLGDTLGALAVVEAYRKKSEKDVSVICNLDGRYFTRSYPNLTFLPHEAEPQFLPASGKYLFDGKIHREYHRIFYDFYKPLIEGYAVQLGVTQWESPKIDSFIKDRPIKNRYFCFSTHSTAQAKHWNYPNGWDLLCRALRKRGITPVCIDRHESFGIQGHWNVLPKSAVKKTGLSLEEMTNFIHHAEFFIGVSSGLSWVAHSLGKPVVMISGSTSKDNEFSEKTLRIINESVCHGCINKKGVVFDSGDWLWCPFHRGTKNWFECTSSISPEEVIQKMEDAGFLQGFLKS